jgi:hypothetical protein
MEPHQLASLLLASAVNAVIPGPGMVLAIARAASDGLGAGIKVSLGMILETLLIRCAVCAVLVGLFHLSELCGPAASRSGAWSWRSSRSRSSPQCRTTAAKHVPSRTRDLRQARRYRRLRIARMGDVAGGLLDRAHEPGSPALHARARTAIRRHDPGHPALLA